MGKKKHKKRKSLKRFVKWIVRIAIALGTLLTGLATIIQALKK